MYLYANGQLRLSGQKEREREELCWSQHALDLFSDDFPVGVSCGKDVRLFHIFSDSTP